MYKSLVIILTALFFFLTTNSAEAAGCAIVYGGGEIACAKAITPTPIPLSQASQNQTKGGLPVYNTTSSATTPNTGPETLGLFGLIPMALGGFWLRKKTK